jgi:alpha-mannosidase
MDPTDISRRRFLAGAAAAALASRFAEGQSTQPAPSYWYVDGYHGGIDGHMPAKSLANVLDGLDRFPEWKVTFEIEPYSWAAFAKSDPLSIERMRKYVSTDPLEARIELVSAAYGQTYAWNINGESNIRQLIYGLAEIHAVFPDLVVDTYAVQEPCWTSCLPQLLKGLGYKRAVLDNSTDWGGYHAPMLNADVVHWQSSDGTSISAVPRYAVDPLIGPATERNAQPSAEYVDQCRKAGVAHPAGTILQDMGWPGKPWRLGIS